MNDFLLYFDQDCKPITYEEWIESFKDISYKIIKKDNVGPYIISTVWLGINHQFLPAESPMIFETMIFCEDKKDELYHEMQRYTYKEQAIEGHDEMVQRCMVKLGMHSE